MCSFIFSVYCCKCSLILLVPTTRFHYLMLIDETVKKGLEYRFASLTSRAFFHVLLLAHSGKTKACIWIRMKEAPSLLWKSTLALIPWIKKLGKGGLTRFEGKWGICLEIAHNLEDPSTYFPRHSDLTTRDGNETYFRLRPPLPLTIPATTVTKLRGSC